MVEGGTMPVDVRVPPLGESVFEATVGRWLKSAGDAVTKGEPLAELETDKVTLDVAAEADGVLAQVRQPTGSVVGVGDVLATIDEAGETGALSTSAAPPADIAPDARPVDAALDAPPVTPLARRVAEDRQIDVREVQGTGTRGRVTRDDIERAGQEPENGQATAAAASPPATDGRPEERVRLSRRRLTIARRLVEAQHTAAMLTTFNEVDMSAVMAVRARRRDAFKERHGVGLGFMSFFTRATVGALRAFPRLNAEIDGDEMVLKSYYDIGIAVAAEEGLVVPVVRDADRKSFATIEREIADLAERARSNALSLAELQGGTFTITNGGVFGSLLSTPILNTPQVGILGMHKIEQRPVVVDGAVAVRPMMYLALSYDHRIVDGSEAVRFLVRVKELIEDPEILLLDG
jgi:2-oxoglutarate dehydrogenase E2 component (dihydrolipoamide succinyltransferase)